VTLTGPGIDAENRHVADAIADFSDPADDRHDLWDAYVTARRNLHAAREYGAEDAGLAELSDAVESAWTELARELPASVRLAFKEARLVAHLLDDRAGRIGIVQ
jgi:hypothetical protein